MTATPLQRASFETSPPAPSTRKGSNAPTFAQRDGFGAPKRGPALHIGAKWSKCMHGRNRPPLHSENFRKFFALPSLLLGLIAAISRVVERILLGALGQAHGKPFRIKRLRCLGLGSIHLRRQGHALAAHARHL